MVIPSPASEISLFYDDGTLIIRTPKGRLDFGSRATDASLADALPKDQNRTALVQRLGLYDGVERLIAARRVPGYPLIVHAGINTEAALAGWREEVAYLSIATALLEAILVWVASLVWRQLRARSALARVLVNQDRVEKQRLDAALQLETVISAMPGLVIRLHRNAQDELRPSYISPSVKVLTGYSAEEVANPDWPPNHIEHGDFLRLRLAEAEALDKGQSSAEVTVFHRDGRPRRLSGKLRARRSESGEDELIVVWTDVTVEHEMTAQLAEAYTVAGNENHELVIPAGLAFARVFKERSDLNLYQPDKRHPTLIGTYLAASVIYSALYGRSPEVNSYDAGLPPDVAKYLRKTAWEVTRAYYDGK